jgi:hypothetical protein
MPYPVLAPQTDQYQKGLAEDYLDTSLLTHRNIAVSLVNGNLEQWQVIFDTAGIKSVFLINLSSNQVKIRSTSQELEVKLSQMTGLVWNSCNTIYKYVIIMHHIILSNRTVSEEKELLANTVRDLTALI